MAVDMLLANLGTTAPSPGIVSYGSAGRCSQEFPITNITSESWPPLLYTRCGSLVSGDEVDSPTPRAWRVHSLES